MKKLFTDAFIQKISVLETELITLQNTFSGTSSEYSQNMLAKAIQALKVITHNNDADFIKKQLNLQDDVNSLLSISHFIDGETGLFIPVVFDDLSLVLAKKAYVFLKALEIQNSIEKNESPLLALLAAQLIQLIPGKSKAHYLIQLKTQIDFFELLQNSKKMGDKSLKTSKKLSAKFTKIYDSVTEQADLMHLKANYNTLVQEYLAKVNIENYPISCIFSDAYLNAKTPITTSMIFGGAGLDEGFTDGRGAQKIYTQLLSNELMLNIKLAETGLISSQEECITTALNAMAGLTTQDNVNKVMASASQLIHQFNNAVNLYKSGKHLSENKSGLFGKTLGTLQSIKGPDIRKLAILQGLETNLLNKQSAIDKNDTTLSHVLNLFKLVMKAKFAHEQLVANTSKLSLGEASKMLNELSNQFCMLLLSLNAGCEKALLQQVEYQKFDLANKVHFKPLASTTTFKA